jgi:hypothetical protein
VIFLPYLSSRLNPATPKIESRRKGYLKGKPGKAANCKSPGGKSPDMKIDRSLALKRKKNAEPHLRK